MLLNLVANYDLKSILFAFGLTLIAGLSTGIGSLLAMFTKTTSKKFLSISLGMSAGVMIYISFVELLNESFEALKTELGESLGPWITIISFFVGMGIIAIIDKVIPEAKNPHEALKIEEIDDEKCVTVECSDEKEKKLKQRQLLKTGILTAVVIGIHNFPEGIATFISALTNPTLAIGVTIAIALHNIPEGISVYVPIYYATGDKKKAFLLSFLSGLAEPIGALFGFLILMPFLSMTMFGILYAAVAGIMVFISLDELLPAAREYGEPHLAIYGMVFGMIIMAVSLLLF
ncbi:MAG: zinc transporter ZupT [Bacilli bacterium]|jgi:ZIP family zinc transporter